MIYLTSLFSSAQLFSATPVLVSDAEDFEDVVGGREAEEDGAVYIAAACTQCDECHVPFEELEALVDAIF